MAAVTRTSLTAAMCRAAAVAALAAAAGCARFDLAEPIELVPARGWTDVEVATLDAAATCWNLGFGTRFAVTSAPAARQLVDVAYNDLACVGGAGGVFTPGIAAEIDICPPAYWETEPGLVGYGHPLFTVLVHELGHAAGIRVEGEGELSIMGRAGQSHYLGGAAFSDEDRRLLADAAPDFVPAPACAAPIMVGDATTGVVCRCP